jgi:hypothetical protein
MGGRADRRALVTTPERERLRLLELERWIAHVRLAAVLFAALEVGTLTCSVRSGANGGSTFSVELPF